MAVDAKVEKVSESLQCETDGCERRRADEPHVCPFREEIDDDDKTLCWCCDECVMQCAMDI